MQTHKRQATCLLVSHWTYMSFFVSPIGSTGYNLMRRAVMPLLFVITDLRAICQPAGDVSPKCRILFSIRAVSPRSP